MALATTLGREHALSKLAERRANPPTQVRNSDLVAGSSMYYYCKACAHLADVLPEAHWSRPKPLCDECQALQDLGWLS